MTSLVCGVLSRHDRVLPATLGGLSTEGLQAVIANVVVNRSHSSLLSHSHRNAIADTHVFTAVLECFTHSTLPP